MKKIHDMKEDKWKTNPFAKAWKNKNMNVALERAKKKAGSGGVGVMTSHYSGKKYTL